MENDVAIFLDLDNVLIGSIEANLTFDINSILEHIRTLTSGRIVLRRAYGDWRQRESMTKELAAAGFELQSTVRLNNMSKNLADMQMVVDAMSTLIDGNNFATYVLITGDRDFVPLVQALRKRGKSVIGLGVRHTSSNNLVRLCDHYIYYDEMISAAHQLLDEQMEDILQRAVEQLLQEETQVPASLLKQRMQALSKGAFNRSPQGKRNFRKFLSEYPHLVQLHQEDTTLYISRPGKATAAPQTDNGDHTRYLNDDEIRALLERSLNELLQNGQPVRASLLKQSMQELSDGAFNETLQGDKSFRKFLDRYADQVRIEQEGSTLYVSRHAGNQTNNGAAADKTLSPKATSQLLQQALEELLVDQPRVRASLLKQKMQELSDGDFDETQQGYENFRHFLEHYPELVTVQQKGTTLLAQRPENLVDQAELHLHYRSNLKKRGLRVVPSAVRLEVLRSLIEMLRKVGQAPWRELVDAIAEKNGGELEISKSFVNDVLRLARRAEVVGVGTANRLAAAPVSLQLAGGRVFQDAVIRCDATYLKELQALGLPFDLEEASLALYETVGHARYLKVVLNRFTDGSTSPAA
jgi:uncharacterized LabA/DUF88 family protein